MKQFTRQNSIWIILLVILLSRLPFINSGYGSEEDAWGLRVTAEKIDKNKAYEVSRLPGHPFQEIIYSRLWNYGPVAFNLLTVLISTAGIAFFILTLKKLSIISAEASGLVLAFTPVIYINSMNAMDYTWALSFILIAFYFLISSRMVLAGIFLGLAIGCRITSGAMLIPFVIYLLFHPEKKNNFKNVLLIVITAIITAVVLFIPAYQVYGWTFFTYYEHFPVPGFAKNFYKATIGVWGMIGFILIVIFLFASFMRLKKELKTNTLSDLNKRLIIVCITTLILYIISFCRLPLKSAFLIPVIPFTILIVALNFKKEYMNFLAGLMIVSSFSFGVNLSDPYRGSEESSMAYIINTANQKISIDPLAGPVIADQSKQKKMIHYCKEVINKTKQLPDSSMIISGWYLNYILVLQGDENKNQQFVYYTDEASLMHQKERGFPVYFLAGQDEFNDLRFKGNFTGKYSKPL
jgi:hypothetical protein